MGHPNQMPPHLAPLSVEEQQLYSEPLPDDWIFHLLYKGDPWYSMEKTNFKTNGNNATKMFFLLKL